MNKNKLNAVVHKVSQITGIRYNSILAYYFMEDVLLKISESEYRDNFVFKGGFLLSNMVSVKTRTTMDIDLLLRDNMLSEDNIERILIENITQNKSHLFSVLPLFNNNTSFI